MSTSVITTWPKSVVCFKQGLLAAGSASITAYFWRSTAHYRSRSVLLQCSDSSGSGARPCTWPTRTSLAMIIGRAWQSALGGTCILIPVYAHASESTSIWTCAMHARCVRASYHCRPLFFLSIALRIPLKPPPPVTNFFRLAAMCELMRWPLTQITFLDVFLIYFNVNVPVGTCTAHGIIHKHEIAHVRQYSNRLFCMLAARLLIFFESLAQ